MNFGQAVEAAKSGKKIARHGWNGKDQFVIKAGGYTVSEPRPGSDYAKAGITGEFTIQPHLDLKNSQGQMQPGWVPSQGDLFADDWVVVGEESVNSAGVKYSPYQARVIEEENELTQKINALEAFIYTPDSIFNRLSIDEQSRLREQLVLMIKYKLVLRRRIRYFYTAI